MYDRQIYTDTMPGVLVGNIEGDPVLYTGDGFERWRVCAPEDADGYNRDGVPHELLGELTEDEALQFLV